MAKGGGKNAVQRQNISVAGLGKGNRKAKASWEYFGFAPNERYGWSALLSRSEVVIVTD